MCSSDLLRGASSRNEIRVLLGAALAFFSVTVSDQPVRGDIVELKDGGVICGKVLNPQSGLMVQIQADDGTLVEVDRKLVKIRISLDRDKKYAEDVKQRGDSLEDHRAIVEQCSAAQMNNIANAHRERIVELDPNDRATWEAMRYYPDEATGKWLRREIGRAHV